jgi:hypothetical protein
MTDLYKHTDVNELKYKDFNIKKKITVNKSVVNNKYGILIFYRPDCSHCQESVFLWSQLANDFKNFNIMSYNVDDFESGNDKLREYIIIPSFPTIKYITKTGTMQKFDEKIKYDNLFFFMCKKLKC